jgi:hypothetical protein
LVESGAYSRPPAEMTHTGDLWRFSRLRQCKYLDNIVEHDPRRIKRLVRPGVGFGSFGAARRTLAGYEAMAMIRKGQVYNIGGRCRPRPPSLPASSSWPSEINRRSSLRTSMSR